jgi:hypothetical protein
MRCRSHPLHVRALLVRTGGIVLQKIDQDSDS